MNLQLATYSLVFALQTVMVAQAQSPSAPAGATRVTVDNFNRAESDMYFDRFVKEGGFGKFNHERELASIDDQTVVRLNRDTLYSFGVFDMNAGPVTVTLPETGKRFMSLQVINEDQYAQDVFYAPGKYTITKDQVGTPYVALGVRTFVDPNDPADLKAVHALQNAIKVEQQGTGKFAVPNWDQQSQTEIRKALVALAAANGGLDSTRMFGRKDQVDPIQHLIGSAAGWGGNPRTAAMYVGVEPQQNDGKTNYRLTVKDVPVDGFWSISVYNADGYFVKNAQNAYSLNNITAKANADGSFTIQFGGCDGELPNCLPIMNGWNYTVRMYRPQQEILDGTWKFPEAQPMTAEPGDAMLAGSWVLVELNGNAVAGRDVTMEFDTDAGRAAGSTGVNRWSGSYKQSGQSLEFGPLISTRRAGPPEAMELEREFTQALDDVTQFVNETGRLVLSAGDKKLLLFERSKD